MKILQATAVATLMVSSSLAPSYGVETRSQTQSDPNKPGDPDPDDIAVQIWKTEALIQIHQLEIENLGAQLQILQDWQAQGLTKLPKDKAEQVK